MGNIFNLDNKFFRAVNKIVDCVCLSMLWLLFCIPIFTIGASNTALYYTVNKVIRHDRGYISSEFWHAFKTNFKQSTLAWLIVLAAGILMCTDAYIMYQFAKAGEKSGVLYYVFIIFFAFLIMWANYIFSYIARFENNLKHTLKNTALIAIGSFLRTILLLVLFVICALAIYIFPFAIIFVPSLYMVIKNRVMENIFRKYMSEEDIAAEEERNREYFN